MKIADMLPTPYDSTLMRWLANLAYLLAGLIYLPVAVYNALFLGKNRRGWRQRFGFVPSYDPSQRRIWIHAVSLGEVNATPRLVEELRERLPDFEIVVSTTTDTGYARAVHLYGVDHVFRFPLDFSPVISRMLRRVRPSMIVLIELELWYNLVHMATRRGVPVVIVNGRLTERSARRFSRLGSVARSMFSKLAWVGAQDEAIAERFRRLGVSPDRIDVTASLKWDSADVSDRVSGGDELAQSLGIDGKNPVWVCGSTGPGEETIILDAYRRLLGEWDSMAQDVPDRSSVRSQPVLVLVPRKPERFDEVARLVARRGLECVRRSERPDGSRAPDVVADTALPAVFLGDTLGELRKFYALADVVFVGRTLVDMGGSDPMEVAALGKPIVVGPHTDNFRDPIDALRSGDAIRIVNGAEELSDAVSALLRDRAAADAMGNRARGVVVENQGATRRTVERLVSLLQTSAAGSMMAAKEPLEAPAR